jgi:hypothetical protein
MKGRSVMENERKKDKNEQVKSKTYVKPRVVKHTAASLVVGSGSSCSCSMYAASQCSNTYFH